jgi:coenzyme F420 biosynthesis associated uncharacterized protein
MRRAFGRGVALGAAYGLVAVLVAEAVRPRGGTAALLDWDEVARLAAGRLHGERTAPARLARAAAAYNRFAAELREPLIEAVGGLPAGARLPDFEALDRARWLELNVGILRRVMEPLAPATLVPDSWLAQAGRAGLSRTVALMLELLGRRVLGQFDPQLLGREPVRPALYLVEPNVAALQRRAGLPGDDLRRWLILHEMTHAWQFAAHPWLREHLDRQVEALVGLRAVAVGARPQRDREPQPKATALVRRMQATMSLVEGHGNLVMNLVGRRVLASFEHLQAAHRRHGDRRGPLEQLAWRMTGLEMKMAQYRVGERFALAVHDRYGMGALNRAWDGPDALPRPEELADPERWHRRVVGEPSKRE